MPDAVPVLRLHHVGTSVPDLDGELAAELRHQGLKRFTLATPDLEARMRALQARGVAFATPAGEVPGSGGERWAFFRDLDGLLVALDQLTRP